MSKLILSSTDIEKWKLSLAYHKIKSFILKINEFIRSKPFSKFRDTQHPLYTTLDDMLAIIEETPLMPRENQRFGNAGFRIFFSKFEKYISDRGEYDEAIKTYLRGAFGNHVRIDYGTGHELSWIALLAILYDRQPGCEEQMIIATKKYLDIVRKLQTKFTLEPAGSHGVWGLDDYQFIPFLWGSSQLEGSSITPDQSIHKSIIKQERGDYFYLDALYFLLDIKGENISQHSPILHDISAIPEWKRINAGLLKMYQCEVMEKFPVVQHFLFTEELSFHKY